MVDFKISIENVECPTLQRYTLITAIIYGVMIVLSIIGAICAAAGAVHGFMIFCKSLFIFIHYFHFHYY